MTTASAHILVVDDDPEMLELIHDYLTEYDLRVTTVNTGAQMRGTLAEQTVDLVVLDLRLNGEDGMQLARELRQESQIPLIIVTGRLGDADRILGLELGADDYMTKPFIPRELLARIRAVLRRYQVGGEQRSGRGSTNCRAYRFEGWELNLRTRRLTNPEGRRVELSNGEFNLLQAFCRAPQRALSRDQILDLSRLNGAEVYDRSIDVQILRLRRKIEDDASAPRFIRTERGHGYFFSAAVEVLV
jgi:DNA-binding response OmpR family regulator